jgi:hypothetical protein
VALNFEIKEDIHLCMKTQKIICALIEHNRHSSAHDQNTEDVNGTQLKLKQAYLSCIKNV